VTRCRELAHDLLVRAEELLQTTPASALGSVLVGYVAEIEALRDRLAAHERLQ
jgi:hypothetical protein